MRRLGRRGQEDRVGPLAGGAGVEAADGGGGADPNIERGRGFAGDARFYWYNATFLGGDARLVGRNAIGSGERILGHGFRTD